jgi:hypothetical protein
MNARRDSSDEPETGSFGGRALLVGAVVFAAAATGVLVLSEEQKWLRLGIVAALWAALVGAFLAAKYRRQLADQETAAADRQEIYELELEREIAARREYELELAAETKRQAEEESRDDIAALRGELQTLRQTLESLLGGEFLVERYALRAESTRMRSLPEDRSFAPRSDLKRLPAAQARDEVVPAVAREAETELIERIVEVHHKPRREPQPHREPAPPRPEPRVETRSDARPPTLPRRAERPARTEWPTPEPVKPAKPVTSARPGQPVKPVTPAQPARRAEPEPTRYVEHPAEMSDRWFITEGPGDQAPTRQSPAAAQRDPSMPFGTTAEQTSWLAQYNKPQNGAPPAGEPTYGSRAYVQPARPQPPAAPPEPALTDRPSRRAAEFHEEQAQTGRRRRPEEDEDTGGGRRRRAEGQPSWQETVGRGGEAEPSSGSHASGRSVNELLASHGADGSPRRRRRRED